MLIIVSAYNLEGARPQQFNVDLRQSLYRLYCPVTYTSTDLQSELVEAEHVREMVCSHDIASNQRVTYLDFDLLGSVGISQRIVSVVVAQRRWTTTAYQLCQQVTCGH